MPTNREFPDNYFDDPDGWGRQRAGHARRRRPIHWGQAIFTIGVVTLLGLSATGQLGSAWNGLTGSSANPATPTAPVQPQAPSASPPTGATAPATTNQGGERRFLLAVGTPMPGAGRNPHLQAFGLKSGIAVRSYSPMPVVISVNAGYGSAFGPLATLTSGQSASQALVTGKRYGYCFAQASGDGFQETRGCGTEWWTETVNGVELPSGSPITTSISFRTW